MWLEQNSQNDQILGFFRKIKWVFSNINLEDFKIAACGEL